MGAAGEDLQVFDAGIVLHDGSGIEDIAAIPSHFLEHFSAERANLIGLAETQQDIGNAAAESKFIMKFVVHLENVVLVAMKNDAALRQFAEGVEVMFPSALGVKE